MGGKGSQYVGLTTLPPSCADCHEIWDPQDLYRIFFSITSCLKYLTEGSCKVQCILLQVSRIQTHGS
jgi:hypothetical protein